MIFRSRRHGDGADALVAAAERTGVTDERILDALREVPREEFVPDQHRADAYIDRPVPIPHGQTTSQPSLIAAMIQTLGLEPDDTVLEVGTGYGFQTALLAKLARHVYSIDRYERLTEAARANLDAAGIDNVTVVTGDGSDGMPEHAPFDAIIVAAAAPDLPPAWTDQLVVGGRLTVPMGPGGAERVVVYQRTEDGLEERAMLTRAAFVRLRRGTGD